MTAKLDEVARGCSSAIISALIILLLSILANIGIYTGAARVMQELHMFYWLSITGIIAGMIEAAIIGLIFAYLFGYAYNRLTKS